MELEKRIINVLFFSPFDLFSFWEMLGSCASQLFGLTEKNVK